MAIKPKDIKFEEAALRKRLEFVRNLKEALQQEDTLVAQTVNAYTNLIDDIIHDIALEVHRAVKTGMDDLEDCRQRQQATEEVGDATIAGPSPPLPSPLALGVQMSGSKGAIDMFGNMVQPVALEQVKCPNCGRTLAAGRFAPHLDKCMMGRGRQASRGVKRFYDGDT